MNSVKIQVQVEADLHRRAKAAAALRGQTISDIVRDALATLAERGSTTKGGDKGK